MARRAVYTLISDTYRKKTEAKYIFGKELLIFRVYGAERFCMVFFAQRKKFPYLRGLQTLVNSSENLYYKFAVLYKAKLVWYNIIELLWNARNERTDFLR